MTSAGKFSTLAKRVLVHLADLCSSTLDQVKVDSRVEVLVHDILLAFKKREGASPSAVRVALLDWIDAGLVEQVGIDADPDLLADNAAVTLRVRGVERARELVGEGVPSTLVRLVHKTGRGYFECRFDTGNNELDRSLNKKGGALACFYLLSAIEPKQEKPMIVSECGPMLERLVKHGIRRRSGPRADKGSLSDETMRATLTALRAILPLKQGWSDADQREDYWYLEADFPDVLLIPSSPDGYQTWDWLRSAVFRILRGENYMLPSGQWEQPDGRIVGETRAAPAVPPTTDAASD